VQADRDLGVQVGVDVGQDLELALLDGAGVALAELEGEGLDDVRLLQRGQAAVEHRRLREMITERERALPDHRALDRAGGLHVCALIRRGDQRLAAVDAVGAVGSQAGRDGALVQPREPSTVENRTKTSVRSPLLARNPALVTGRPVP
jgi:hypothetical protein